MRLIIMKRIIFTLAVFLLSNPILAFDLFNPERGKPPAPVRKAPQFPSRFQPAVPPKRTIPAPPPKKLLPQKDFTLLGTSRIGKKRTVILRGPDRNEFILRFKNKRTPIKKYKGYYLLKVEARDILIEYPEDAPCRRSNEKKGIICSADQKTATVSLKRGKAITPLATAPRKTPSMPPPFTRQTQPPMAPRPNRHPPQEGYKMPPKTKIKPENVPPGMRLIHTPFGDRLMPIK
jgi:hypothetical protein